MMMCSIDRLGNKFDLQLLRNLWIADILLLAFYLALGILVVFGAIPSIPDAFSIGSDWSVPETFNYAKWIVVIGFLLMIFAQRKLSWTLSLACCFMIVLADDALQFHEQLGRLIGQFWSYTSDVGGLSQLLAFSMIGIPVLGTLATAWLLAGPTDRNKVAHLVGLVAAIAVIAVGLDFIHDALDLNRIGYSLFLLPEEGGEMLLTSAIVSYVSQSIYKEFTVDGASDQSIEN